MNNKKQLANQTLQAVFLLEGDGNLLGNFEGIKLQKFGVEVECTGLTREAAAKAISKVLGGSPDHFGGSYDRYDVYDNQGRRWKILSDASISYPLTVQ